MNQEPEARRLKRAAPRRRTVAAIAVGALALGGLAVLPLIGAQAVATTAVSGSVATSAAGNAAVSGATVTAYRVTGTASTAVATATTNGSGVFDFAGTLDTANSYKFKVNAAGFQTGFYATASGATPYTPSAPVSTYAAATTITPVATTVLASGTAGAGSILLAPAGVNASTVSVTSVSPINNDGTVGSGPVANGQKARIAVTVTAAAGPTPTGFVTLDGGNAFTADGTQMATLSGGTATIDAIVTGTPSTTRTVTIGYSGDASATPGTVTKSDVTVGSSAGTFTGTISGLAANSGVTVQAYSNPATGTPVVVATTTTDANGVYRLTVPNSTATGATGGYKLRYSKVGAIAEYDATNSGTATFALAGNGVTIDNATVVADEVLAAVGATAPSIAVVVTPSAPRVGQTVTYAVTVNGPASGTVNFSDGTVLQEQALNGSGQASLTRTFSSAGAQTVTVVYNGDSTRAVGSRAETVTIVDGGGVISGTVTPLAAVSGGAGRVHVYDANTGAVISGSPVTVANDGTYQLAVPAGTYKVRFSTTTNTYIPEWHNNKMTFTEADATGAATVDALLVATGATAIPAASAITFSPAAPVVGQPYTGTFTIAGATGTVFVSGPSALEPRTAVKLDSTGKATLTFPAPTAAGALATTVSYSGDATYLGGTVALTNPTAVVATQTVVTSSIPTSRSGVDPLIKATVRDSSGALVNAGTVTFKKGATTIGTASAATGVAALSGALTIGTGGITEGANVITAEYSGTGFGSSTSAPFNQTVVKNQGRLTTVSPFRALQPTAVGAGASTDIVFASKPAGAVAVQLNVTASGVNANTYLSVCPGGTPLATCKLSSTVNSAGPDTRNFTIVPLGGAGTDTVTVYNNLGSTLVSADVYGWVIDEAGTDGALSVYSPARFGDAIPFGPQSVSTVTFDDVPAGATAIALNVTVAGVTGNTFLSACPVTVTTEVCKEKSIINSNGRDMANFVIVPLSGPQGNKVKFYNNAGVVSQMLLDVAGYVVGTPSSVSNGRFQAVAPVRAIAPTTIAAGTFANVTLTGVPAGATAVAINLTAAGVNANTYYSICPGTMSDATCKQTSVLNSAGPDTAGFVIVQLGAGNTLKIYNNAGSPLAIGDVTGWVIG